MALHPRVGPRGHRRIPPPAVARHAEQPRPTSASTTSLDRRPHRSTTALAPGDADHRAAAGTTAPATTAATTAPTATRRREGGRPGRRVRHPPAPLTAHTPKQMLPIVDRPMIEHVVDPPGRPRRRPRPCCRSATGPTPSSRPTPTTRAPGWPCTTPSSPSRSTPPAPSASRPSTPASTTRFLVVNGDVLTDLDVGALWAFHHAHRGRGHHRPDPGRRPVALRRGAHRRRRPGRAPSSRSRRRATAPTNWINAGTYVLEPSVLDRIAGRAARCRSSGRSFPAMVADRPLYAMQPRRPTGSTPAPRPPTCRPSSTCSTAGAGRPEPAVHPSAVVGEGAEVEHVGR